jgi:hypothetical protein
MHLEIVDLVQPPFFFFTASEAEAVFFYFPIAQRGPSVEALEIGGAGARAATMAVGRAMEKMNKNGRGVNAHRAFPKSFIPRAEGICTVLFPSVPRGDHQRKRVAKCGGEPSPH